MDIFSHILIQKQQMCYPPPPPIRRGGQGVGFKYARGGGRLLSLLRFYVTAPSKHCHKCMFISRFLSYFYSARVLG